MSLASRIVICLFFSNNTHFFQKWANRRSPGIKRKAGKVMRLNRPKTPTIPSTVEASRDDRCYKKRSPSQYQSSPACICIQSVAEDTVRTLSSTMRWMRTKLQATTRVSTEFEKVCVW